MKIGVIKTSLKENEKRLPIYPDHLNSINHTIRQGMVFETGYGVEYGFSDHYLKEYGVAIDEREKIFDCCDLLILPKPVKEDMMLMKNNQILWGWPHCVQQKEITQIAIDKKLTLIAWEAMHHWSDADVKLMHIFYKNNEMAGYAAVIHVLSLLGIDGFYCPRRKVVVIGNGSCSRGAIFALHGRGFNNIHVYTQRPTHLVSHQHPDVYYHHLHVDSNGSIFSKNIDNALTPFIDILSEADIICNCVLQDTDKPLIFVNDKEVDTLKPNTAIIDVSCDYGMGFSFARPTSFNEPMFQVAGKISYYSVDHTPSYLWNAASREISKALLGYLPIIAKGPDAWMQEKTLKKAIEIKDGIVLNPKILSFQKRDINYPHSILIPLT